MPNKIPCIYVCRECGGTLDCGLPGEASFARAAIKRLCWVCAHLAIAAEREVKLEIAAGA